MLKLIIFAALIKLSLSALINGINDQFFYSTPSSSCPLELPFSCTNSTPIDNSCCFEYPGGIFLQTQFWDYSPPIGDNDTFTLHGLWPDNCDGSYEQFCDNSLDIRNATRIILEEFKDEKLYSNMKRNWKNFNGNDEELWIHEFNKHATCIRTIRPHCYIQDTYKSNLNVYDFYSIAYELYEKLPTFKFLQEEGIMPSRTASYTKKQISDALEKHFGKKVFFKCKSGALQEIWYFHHLKGPLTGKSFAPIDSLMSASCPDNNIKFWPKGEPSRNPPPHFPPVKGIGHIKLAGKDGCLISNGQWYRYGTCATFKIQDSQFGGVNIKSSKGYCGISTTGDLTCSSIIDPKKSQFQVDGATGQISYGGKASWCLDEQKQHGSGKFKQIPIKTCSSDSESFSISLVTR